MEFIDDGISEWTCRGGGQVATSWSHRRPAEPGIMSALRLYHTYHNQSGVGIYRGGPGQISHLACTKDLVIITQESALNSTCVCFWSAT